MSIHIHNFFSPSHLVRRGPGWVAVLQGTKFYQRMPSDSIVNIFIREAPSQHVILHCIHPPFLWPPSLSLSLYPHLSHHSNIFLPISPTYMSIPLKTSPPHAYCYRFYFGLLPFYKYTTVLLLSAHDNSVQTVIKSYIM